MPDKYEWADLSSTPSDRPPREGEVYVVNLPVKVLFEWSKGIVDEVDEFNEPVSFKEGWVMKVFPETHVYQNNSRQYLFSTTKK